MTTLNEKPSFIFACLHFLATNICIGFVQKCFMAQFSKDLWMHFKIDCIELWKLCSNPPLLAPISESYPSPQAYFQSISFPSSVFLILNKNMNILCFFNRVEIFLPDQLRQGGVCFWLPTNIIVVCNLVRESFVICGMLLCTSCWSLFPAYCGYYWTGCICLNCWQYFTKLGKVFVQKIVYPNWSVLINYWGYYWIGHFSFCSKAGFVIEARAKCIGLKSNQWKEVTLIFSRTRSFYKPHVCMCGIFGKSRELKDWRIFVDN